MDNLITINIELAPDPPPPPLKLLGVNHGAPDIPAHNLVAVRFTYYPRYGEKIHAFVFVAANYSAARVESFFYDNPMIFGDGTWTATPILRWKNKRKFFKWLDRQARFTYKDPLWNIVGRFCD